MQKIICYLFLPIAFYLFVGEYYIFVHQFGHFFLYKQILANLLAWLIQFFLHYWAYLHGGSKNGILLAKQPENKKQRNTSAVFYFMQLLCFHYNFRVASQSSFYLHLKPIHFRFCHKVLKDYLVCYLFSK